MKNIILIVSMFIILTSSIFALDSFDAKHCVEKSIIVCFDKSEVPQRSGKIEISYEKGLVKTELPFFNNLSRKFRFKDLAQKYPNIKNKDFEYKGAYVQNVYEVTLESNSNINEALEACVSEKGFVYAEFNPIYYTRYTPDDPMLSQQWHIEKTQSMLAWDYQQGSEEIIIGVVDQGVQWNHPDLQANIWVNQPEVDAGMTINWETGELTGGNGEDDDGNGYIDDAVGFNFFGADNNDSFQNYAPNDHGTHCAGCASAVTDNGTGLAAPGFNTKILGTRHSSTINPSNGIQDSYSGIYYCVDTGADIVSCSWGGPGGEYQANQACNYALANNSLVITAAGNGGADGIGDEHIPGVYEDYPSDAEAAVCVGASDQEDVKTGFSDFGEPIDLFSPGTGIWATINESGYGPKNGTSMACPIAAGIFGLVMAQYPDMTKAEVRDRIYETADFIDDIPGNEDYAGLLGYGRVNAFKALVLGKVPYLKLENFSISELTGDGDNVPNPEEEIAVSIEFSNEINWLDATNVEATLSTDASGVNVLNSETSFEDIDAGSTGTNTTNLTFETDNNLENLIIDFTVNLTADGIDGFEFDQDFTFSVELSFEQEGWPVELSNTPMSHSTIVDVNNDGTNEIVFAETNTIHVANATNSSELPGFPYEMDSNINSAVTVGNIDGDDANEIIAYASGGTLVALDTDGSEIFNVAVAASPSQFVGCPVVADLNNDGINEIIFADKAGIVNAFDNTGNNISGFPQDAAGMIFGSVAVGDITGDGNKEIAVSTLTGDLKLYKNDGSQVSGFPVTGGSSFIGATMVKLGSSDDLKLVIPDVTGNMKCFDANGSEIFAITTDGAIKTEVISGDINNDDVREIVAVTETGNLYVIDENGSTFEGFPYFVDESVSSSPVLADLNANGSLEVIFGDNDGNLHAINNSASEISYFPIKLNSSIKTTPSLGGIDFDGDTEIGISDVNSYTVIDWKKDVTAYSWACFAGNSQRTKCAADISYTPNSDIPHNYITTLGNNYPNPFKIGSSRNNSTRINYEISENGNVSIDVYNIKGQHVKNLRDGYTAKGQKSVDWLGDNSQGSKVSTGVYFYKLKTKNHVETKKMLLIK